MNVIKSIESHSESSPFYDLILGEEGVSNGWEQLMTLDKIKESYDQGFEEGYQAKSKADVFYLKHNLEFALKNAVKYSEHLKKTYSIELKKMFLKICSLEEFSVLIVVSPDDYFSEKMDKVYEELYTYLEAINDENKKLDIVFTLDGESINGEKLTANGFILQYRKDSARQS